VIVIGCFVLFLGSYAVDIYHMIRNDRLRLDVVRNRPALQAGETKEIR